MMHKTKSSRTDELRREYTRSDFPNGFVRGKYAARLRNRPTIEIDGDVQEVAEVIKYRQRFCREPILWQFY